MKWKDGVREVVEHAMKLAKKKEAGLITDFAVGFIDCPEGVDVVFSQTTTNGPHVRATFRLESDGKAPEIGSWWMHKNYENMQVESVSESVVLLVSIGKAHRVTVVRYAWPAGWVSVPVPKTDIYAQSEADVRTKRDEPGATHVRVFDTGKTQVSRDGGQTWYEPL